MDLDSGLPYTDSKSNQCSSIILLMYCTKFTKGSCG